MAQTVPLDRAVTAFMTDAAVTLREEWTIDGALGQLRAHPPAAGAGSQVLYFYVVNGAEQLVGVLSARALVLSPGEARVGELMTRGIITLSEKETLFDALELFALHRLLAIPVVSAEKKLLGVVEVSLYTEEVFDLAHNQQLNEVFQLIGLRLEQQKHGSAWKGFRARMPWLLSNITGGLICAALGAFFEGTVRQVVIIALFIPLILTLAESVSVQSMTLAIEEAMHKGKTRGVFMRELVTAIMLGVCSGVVVGLVSLFWRDRVAATVTIAVSVMLVMVIAATLGRVVPALIHRLKLNPRIASGPITLAVVDVVAITVYLSAATVMLNSEW